MFNDDNEVIEDTRKEVTFISKAPCLTLTLAETTEDHPHGLAVFENGQLKTRCERTIREIRKAIITKPNISQLVSEVNKEAAARIVHEHQKMMSERSSHAHQGALSSSGMRQHAQEILMEQNRQEIESQMGGTAEEREAAAKEITAAGIPMTEASTEVVRNNDIRVEEGAVLKTVAPKVILPPPAKAK